MDFLHSRDFIKEDAMRKMENVVPVIDDLENNNLVQYGSQYSEHVCLYPT